MEKTEAIIREGKRALLSLTHGVQATADWKYISGLMDHYDIDTVTNKAPGEVRSVLFLLTRMVRFAGGQTSVLRIGTELEKLGIYLDSQADVEGKLFESIYEAEWITYSSKDKLKEDVIDFQLDRMLEEYKQELTSLPFEQYLSHHFAFVQKNFAYPCFLSTKNSFLFVYLYLHCLC